MPAIKAFPLSRVILEYDNGSRFEIDGDQVMYAKVVRAWNKPPMLHLDIVAVWLDQPAELNAGQARLSAEADLDRE